MNGRDEGEKGEEKSWAGEHFVSGLVGEEMRDGCEMVVDDQNDESSPSSFSSKASREVTRSHF